jgi:hypothetical protein
MNVSEKADAAFMRELERTDPPRFANLQRNMRHSVRSEQIRSAHPERAEHLGGRPKKHKSNAEKQRAYRNKMRNALTVAKPGAGPFIPQDLQAQNSTPATTTA